jgi:hypothetical protein
VLVCVIFFAALPWREWVTSLNQIGSGGTFRRRGSLGTLLAGFMIATGVGGLWCIYRGICALLVPQAEELTDVE